MKRLWAWRLRRRPEAVRAAIDEEIRFHFHERIEALVAEGYARADAARIAAEEFGDTEAVRRSLTAIDMRLAARRRGAGVLDALREDLRYVTRTLLAAPGFTTIAVIALALGIGATATMFSFVDRLFFRLPDGVQDPSGVIRLYRRFPAPSMQSGGLHYPGFRDIVAAFSPGEVTGYVRRSAVFGRGESPESVNIARVAPHYFSLLRVAAPAMGRYLTDDECRVEAPASVAVVAFDEWQRRFSGDPGVLGRTVELDRRHFTIVGVGPRGFAGADLAAVRYWVPIGAINWPFKPPWHEGRSNASITMLARPATQPVARIAAIATAAFRVGALPRELGFEIIGGPLRSMRGPLPLSTDAKISIRLAGVSVAVLLIACANTAALMLARTIRRRRELALRVALGVSPSRLLSLLFVETAVLSVLSGLAAVVIAHWGSKAMHVFLLRDVDWLDGGFDLRVALFATMAAAATTLATGMPAAVRGARAATQSALQADSRGGGVRRSRAQGTLLAVQVALSVVLLVGAAAFLRSLHAAAAIDTGYDADRLLMISDVRFDDGVSRTKEQSAALERLLPWLQAQPGIEAAALAGMEPLSGYASTSVYEADGASVPGNPWYLRVTSDYFRTAGIELERGRPFSVDEVRDGASVMVINRSMADSLWPGQEALGQCLRIRRVTEPCMTVVGIVGNAHRSGLIDREGRTSLQFFLPAGHGGDEFSLPTAAIVRVAVPDARRLVRPLQDSVRAILPAGMYATVLPMRDSLEPELRPWVTGATLFSIFGGVALLVSALGIASTLAYSVSQRTREMGIRLALGAAPAGVIRLIMREGLLLVGAGIVAGIVLAIALSRSIAVLLYQTSPSDPLVLAGACATMTAAAVAGCLVPAWRAGRVDPIVVLKSE